MKPFAFVFPGQGSQSVGMLDAWGGNPAVREVLAEASAALAEDLGALIAHGPKEALARTTNTQPVMLVAGIAAYRAWMAETGTAPAALAGHSLGEYTALVAAGALALADAVSLVRFRAQVMQEAVPLGAGGMAAVIGLAADQVSAICGAAERESGAVVEAVNFNDPGQTVIAGARAGVARACELLAAAGARRVLPLPVSAPFHSSLMRPAAERLAARLAAVPVAPPRIPVVNNVDATVASDPARIRDALYRQAFGPVRWVECIAALRQRGIGHIVECGPGKVLAGTVRRIDGAIAGGAVYDPATLARTREALA